MTRIVSHSKEFRFCYGQYLTGEYTYGKPTKRWEHKRNQNQPLGNNGGDIVAKTFGL